MNRPTSYNVGVFYNTDTYRYVPGQNRSYSPGQPTKLVALVTVDAVSPEAAANIIFNRLRYNAPEGLRELCVGDVLRVSSGGGTWVLLACEPEGWATVASSEPGRATGITSYRRFVKAATVDTMNANVHNF